jgi:hypothetical protein
MYELSIYHHSILHFAGIAFKMPPSSIQNVTLESDGVLTLRQSTFSWGFMSQKPIRAGDREQKRKKSLQRRVLQHLKHHGPKHYDNLSLLFDLHGTGDTGLAVEALKRRHYLKIGRDGMVQITGSGLRVLEKQT